MNANRQKGTVGTRRQWRERMAQRKVEEEKQIREIEKDTEGYE